MNKLGRELSRVATGTKLSIQVRDGTGIVTNWIDLPGISAEELFKLLSPEPQVLRFAILGHRWESAHGVEFHCVQITNTHGAVLYKSGVQPGKLYRKTAEKWLQDQFGEYAITSDIVFNVTRKRDLYLLGG